MRTYQFRFSEVLTLVVSCASNKITRLGGNYCGKSAENSGRFCASQMQHQSFVYSGSLCAYAVKIKSWIRSKIIIIHGKKETKQTSNLDKCHGNTVLHTAKQIIHLRFSQRPRVLAANLFHHGNRQISNKILGCIDSVVRNRRFLIPISTFTQITNGRAG